ncbi:S8 family peptidase [Saccharibacillus kuerlensis]|uniref:Major intracellular serine protease n=1 Tax=Saccharibacillus kuerlensis TaxID=459527 RepID=A0ABQ2L3L6_9BACL|nr:S8 family peptidase [Saccharibacillus kuerlensis]GGN98878.1 major intracellular serine protease [Saccharibacillus kuerlensis]
MKSRLRVIPYQKDLRIEQVEQIPAGVQLIQAPALWERTRGAGVTIAILDTGCDTKHPDLADRIIGGYNFTNDDDGSTDIYEDYNGHGTHVAGTIAGANSGSGAVGVAPEAKLLILKVLNGEGSGAHDWVIGGIDYAVQQGVDIISMSLGGPDDLPDLHAAIQRAVEAGVLVVCAAGNEGDANETTNEYGYPGYYNEVISVGSVNLALQASAFSNSNNEVDLVAPGEGIFSTYPGGGYATLSGTSMATPHVSGALALIKVIADKEFERTLTEPELYAQLVRRTVPLGTSPRFEGNGLLYLTALEELARAFRPEDVARMLRQR